MTPDESCVRLWCHRCAVLLFLAATSLSAQDLDEARRLRLAESYEASGDWKNAGAVYEELLLADPSSNVYFEGLTRMYIAQRRFSELIPFVSERASRFNRDVRLRALLASLYYRNGNIDGARRLWNEATDAISPNDVDTYMIVASAQVQVGANDLAASTLRRGRTVLRSRNLFAHELAEALGRAHRIEEAVFEYLGLLDAGGQNLEVVKQGLARILTTDESIGRAIVISVEAVTARPDFVPYVELLGWLYQEAGDGEGGLTVAVMLDSLRHSKGSDVYRFADRMLRSDNYELATRALDRFRSIATPAHPLWPIASFAYVQALEGIQRSLEEVPAVALEELVEKYKQIAADNAETSIWSQALLRCVSILMSDLDDVPGALNISRQVVANGLDEATRREGRLFTGILLIRSGDTASGRAILESVARDDQKDCDPRITDEAQLRLAELHFFQGDFDLSADLFLGLTNKVESDVANDALGYLFLMREHATQRGDALRDYAAARLLQLQREFDRAAHLFQTAESKAPRSDIADRCQLERARMDVRRGEIDAAVSRLVGLADSRPEGLISDLALFEAARACERSTETRARALGLYARLFADYPTSTFVAMARVRVMRLRTDG